MKIPVLFILLFLIFISTHAQNSALFFNADEKNYIITPSSSIYYPVNNFTIEFWMKTSRQTTQDMAIINKAECVTNKFSFAVTLNSNYQIYFSFTCNGNCSNSHIFLCDKVLDKGKCYHVAVTYSSDSVNIYIDGILQTGIFTVGTEYCGDLFLSPEPMKIGVYRFKADTLGWYYDGMLDEIRIWNHVRTQYQIESMNQQQFMGNESGLLFYYNFNNNIFGNSETVENNASFSGVSLNGVTVSQTSSSPYSINSCFNYLSVDEQISEDKMINIYPNPTDRFINIDYKKEFSNKFKISIYDLSGRVLLTKISELPYIIDMNNFEKGIYIINTSCNDFSKYSEIILY